MLKANEGKACEAIVQRLEERANGKRTGLRFPEQEQHASPVEAAFSIGDQLYALEHTVIEPFEGHMKMEAEADRHFKPIEDALKDALGNTAMFELVIPVNAFQVKKKGEIEAIQKALIEWVKASASTMPKSADGRGTSSSSAATPQVPFAVTLQRFEPAPIPGHHFQISHMVSNGPQLRADRIKKSIEKKFPKLAAWKRDENAKTVLVLEDNDIHLTNPSIVAETFEPLAKARADRPDETYLVVSCTPLWTMWPMLIGDKSYFDFVRSGEWGYHEIEPTGLVSLTKR